MLHQSLISNDDERTQELQRSLLDLERKSEKDLDDDGLPKSVPAQLPRTASTLKSKSCTAVGLEHPEEAGETSSPEALCFSPVEVEYLDKAMRQNMKQYDMQISLMIVGNSLVGKTTLMHSMLGIKPLLQLRPTTGYTCADVMALGWTRMRSIDRSWEKQSSIKCSTQTVRRTTSLSAKVALGLSCSVL